MIEPTGYTALDLVGFTDRGTYAANVNYVKNDLVHYGGSIWRILIDDTIGITPAEGPNYTLYIGEPTNLVERIIAPLEDNPATVAYQTGRQIIYNDHLYEVIQNIGVGDTLIAYEDDPTNANIKLAAPVETQVLALNASKVNKSDIANNVTTTAEGKVLDARQGKALQDGKTDNSVIAPVESGTTASQAYAAGTHFIRDGAFCTAKTAIAQGEAFTLNTNYTAGTVGDRVEDLEDKVNSEGFITLHSNTAWNRNFVAGRWYLVPNTKNIYIEFRIGSYLSGSQYIDINNDYLSLDGFPLKTCTSFAGVNIRMQGNNSILGGVLVVNGNSLTNKTNTTQKLYLDRWMDGGTETNNIVAVDYKGRLSYQ